MCDVGLEALDLLSQKLDEIGGPRLRLDLTAEIYRPLGPLALQEQTPRLGNRDSGAAPLRFRR
jgi:hypothetical protein